MVKVVIIGPAGRSPSQLDNLDEPALKRMEESVKAQIIAWAMEPSDVTLVSGGSAWSDHVAVRLFLSDPSDWAGLELYLPCLFDPIKGFHGHRDSSSLSRYHQNYAAKTGRDPRAEIHEACKKGAVLRQENNGFFSRNRALAKTCDRVIAFTFHPAGDVISPGTLFTWRLCDQKPRASLVIK